MQSTRKCGYETCERASRSLGYCAAHYNQVRRGAKLAPIVQQARKNAPLLERLEANSEMVGECRVWTGTRDSCGYGKIGVKGKKLMVHRVAYELEVGPIPPGLFIDHICHNRACIRPSHLQSVTHKVNVENRAGAMPSSRTGIRGVGRVASGKYRASATHNGKTYSGGRWETVEEAEAAAIALRNKLFTNNLVDRLRSA